MTDQITTYTAFLADVRIAHGSPADVAAEVQRAEATTPRVRPVLVFDDSTGCQLDLDLRGTEAEVRTRYTPAESPRGRGRPKLGVVPREITLLPRHWDWLGKQPGGASAALRRLVDTARRESESDSRERSRAAQEAAYHFLHAMAGDYPGYEEATRALFAGDRVRFAEQIAHWPRDVRAYALSFVNTRVGPDA